MGNNDWKNYEEMVINSKRNLAELLKGHIGPDLEDTLCSHLFNLWLIDCLLKINLSISASIVMQINRLQWADHSEVGIYFSIVL